MRNLIVGGLTLFACACAWNVGTRLGEGALVALLMAGMFLVFLLLSMLAHFSKSQHRQAGNTYNFHNCNVNMLVAQPDQARQGMLSGAQLQRWQVEERKPQVRLIGSDW